MLSEPVFRQESGRIITTLTRIFGLDNIELAEDVAQDVFCRALEVWKLRGIPQNPSAWLMKAAKNRAVDLLRRERTARNYVPELGRLLNSEWTMVATVNQLFSTETIEDDRLRMIFSCCNPQLTQHSQVALTLYLLCGFTIGEIAGGLLCKRAAIEKRIERGKNVLATSKSLFDMADAELPQRLAGVHRTLYLLFNEGYHGASRRSAVRKEFCAEAMRLAALLAQNAAIATPATYALCALMCFHAARLPARTDDNGDLVSLERQDRSQWNATLIGTGRDYLDRAATGDEPSEYHLEAAIASVHCSATRPSETDWDTLRWLYDTLMRMWPSPIVELNRAIAIAQKDGPEEGLRALGAIAATPQLGAYPFLPATIAELELRAGHFDRARVHFQAAIALARNAAERRFLESRIELAVEV